MTMTTDGTSIDDGPSIDDLLLSEETWNRILSSVRRYLPRSYDQESVAERIWTKCWRMGILPSQKMIKRRCIDEIRKADTRKEKEKASAQRRRDRGRETTESEETSLDRTREVSDAIDRARLLPVERKILWLVFWRGDSLKEVEESLGLTHYQFSEILTETLKKVKETLERGLNSQEVR